MGNRGMECFCMAIIWIAMLIFVVWPIALVTAIVWVFLQPFETCARCCRSLLNFLEKLVTWPRETGKAIFSGAVSCPRP
ncbi:hypothetical protein ACA910_002419 [Epithemia clementina (nom. ined.)]